LAAQSYATTQALPHCEPLPTHPAIASIRQRRAAEDKEGTTITGAASLTSSMTADVSAAAAAATAAVTLVVFNMRDVSARSTQQFPPARSPLEVQTLHTPTVARPADTTNTHLIPSAADQHSKANKNIALPRPTKRRKSSLCKQSQATENAA
jgi:hypothetical protein